MNTSLSPSKLEKIAEEAGVSVRTVYRVLQGENKEQWPSSSKRGELIREISRKLGFSPDASARSLRTGRKMQVAVLLRNTEGGTFREHFPEAFEVILGINEALEPAGYSLTMATIGDVLHPRNAHSRIFRERLVDGLVVISQMPEVLIKRIERIMPTCLWVHSNVWREHNCLRRDEHHAGQETAEHLLEKGYRQLVWVGPPKDGEVRHYSESQRLNGVRAAVEQEGSALLHEIDAVDFAELAGRQEELGRLLKPQTAVIAYSTRYAQWLSQCAQAMEKIAPRDFGLACCDGSRLAADLWPGLSRVEFDHFNMGKAAGEMMLENLEGDPGGPGAASRLLCDPWIAGQTIRQSTPPAHSDPDHSNQTC